MADYEEAAENIFVIRQQASMGGIKPPLNMYVLAGDDGLVFDAGYGTRRDIRQAREGVQAIQAELARQGKYCRINRILPSHTHPDHFSGLHGMRRALGVKVLLTDKMARRIVSGDVYRQAYAAPEKQEGAFSHRISGFKRFMHQKMARFFYSRIFGIAFMPNPDVIIEEGSILQVGGEGWDVIAGPGHCDDHVMLYSRERGILLAGDNVLRSITTWLGPPRSDIEDYINTLERIKKLPGLKRILTAHGSPVENPVERVDQIIRYRQLRTDEVEGIIRDGGPAGVTCHNVLDTLYPGERALRRSLVEGWIIVTIQYLERKGIIRREESGREVRFVHTGSH